MEFARRHVNVTESSRRHALRARGVGSTGEAIFARGTRGRKVRAGQVQRGERLPGWVVAGMADNNQIDEFLTTLNLPARKSAMGLLRNLGAESLEPEAPSE